MSALVVPSTIDSRTALIDWVCCPAYGGEIVVKARRQDTYAPYDPAWKYEMGAVDPWYTEVQIAVQGRDETPVILRGVDVDVVERREPLRGVLIPEPGGDLVDVRYITVDLNPARPKLRLGSCYLQGEGERTFLSYTYRGETGSIEINNGGEPFRTTSPGMAVLHRCRSSWPTRGPDPAPPIDLPTRFGGEWS